MLAQHVFPQCASLALSGTAGSHSAGLTFRVNGLGPVGTRLRSQRCPSSGGDGNFLRYGQGLADRGCCFRCTFSPAEQS